LSVTLTTQDVLKHAVLSPCPPGLFLCCAAFFMQLFFCQHSV